MSTTLVCFGPTTPMELVLINCIRCHFFIFDWILRTFGKENVAQIKISSNLQLCVAFISCSGVDELFPSKSSYFQISFRHYLIHVRTQLKWKLRMPRTVRIPLQGARRLRLLQEKLPGEAFKEKSVTRSNENETQTRDQQKSSNDLSMSTERSFKEVKLQLAKSFHFIIYTTEVLISMFV